jgi:ribosomal protein L37AE/L43A
MGELCPECGGELEPREESGMYYCRHCDWRWTAAQVEGCH